MVRESRQEIGMSKRIVDYDALRDRIPEIISSAVPEPRTWLDIGCGAGGSIRKSLQSFPSCEFTLADPSSENLKEAKELAGKSGRCSFLKASSHELSLPDGSFDVITAILSHHYYPDIGTKRKVAANCLRMLREGGVFLYVEHTIHEDGQQAKDEEWRGYMRSKGLEESHIQEMFDRRDTVYFPFEERDHVEMLSETGFKDIRVFWRTCSDIGLISRK